MKVLLVRSPRYYWPFINEYDNFLLPQSLPCLAAVLRREGHQVRAVDCMPLKMGWKSLGKLMAQEKPDVVGVGDSETVYCYDALRVLEMAKELVPGVVTVAGGAHFSNLVEETLKGFPVDVIARGEGEKTIVELVRELEQPSPDLHKVRGIAFLEGDEVVRTPPQPLVGRLDDLPMPAYDLMPMAAYGKAKYLFDPGGVTVHHSRGCADSCKFCVWWTQMARRKEGPDGEEVLMPSWRTKSVAYIVEEIEWLISGFDKRGFVFVDDSWNMSQKWGDAFAEEVLRRRLQFNWFAFMRADCMLRDEKAGTLEKLVRAGLRHVCIGVERASSAWLSDMHKDFYSEDLVKECFHLLSRKYPQVFRQATFIVGVRDESRETMLAQADYAKEIKADFPAFHPMTPVPGTELWREAKAQGWLEIDDFRFYDWYTPVMSSDYLSREEIEYLMYVLNRRFTNVIWLLKGLGSRHPYRRKMYVWWLLVLMRVVGAKIREKTLPRKFQDVTGLVRPAFYDA